jgi:hypothetical protein
MLGRAPWLKGPGVGIEGEAGVLRMVNQSDQSKSNRIAETGGPEGFTQRHQGPKGAKGFQAGELRWGAVGGYAGCRGGRLG